jgi:hypothetical protein
MSFDPGSRPSRPSRQWAVRLFETSDKLEEHLNKNNVRPDQVASITIDADGFFVLVHHLGAPPMERRPPAFEASGRPPPRRPRFDEDEGPREEEDEFPRPRRTFDRPSGGFDRAGGPPSRGGGFNRGGDAPRRDFPPRRTPRR